MMRRPQILVVDDEPQIRRFLEPSLVASGYDVVCAGTGGEALRMIASGRIEAIVLDLGLPDMDGKDVIAKVRQTSAVPIIVLSARDQEAEKIAALDLGACDYVNKPFGIGELLARIRSALRRSAAPLQEVPAISRIGAIEIDTAQRRVTRDGKAVHLTPKEFELLLLLVRHAGRVMTHRQILTQVWGPAHASDTQYLRVFIGQLRQKLEDDPSDQKLILTEPGVGYRVADVEQETGP